MNLELDENIMADAIRSATMGAVQDAIGSYSVKTSIQDAVAGGTLTTVLRAAVLQALDAVQVQDIASALSREIGAAITIGVVALVEEAMTDLVGRMRGVPAYDCDARRAALQSIRAELFGTPT